MPIQTQARITRLTAHLPLPVFGAAGCLKRNFTPRYKQRLISEENRAWAKMVHGIAPWSVMVTLTFKRRDAKGYRVTPTGVEKAIRHLLRLINCDFFGRRLTDKKWTVATAVTLDWGQHGDHPHAHILLSAPNGVSDLQLCTVVERAAQRTKLIAPQRQYSRYYSAGGAEYLINHGTDRMVVSLLSHANHRPLR